jgi:hypothetical protein
MDTSYAQIAETNEIIMNTTMSVIVMSGYLGLVFCSAVVININEYLGLLFCSAVVININETGHYRVKEGLYILNGRRVLPQNFEFVILRYLCSSRVLRHKF